MESTNRRAVLRGVALSSVAALAAIPVTAEAAADPVIVAEQEAARLEAHWEILRRHLDRWNLPERWSPELADMPQEIRISPVYADPVTSAVDRKSIEKANAHFFAVINELGDIKEENLSETTREMFARHRALGQQRLAWFDAETARRERVLTESGYRAAEAEEQGAFERLHNAFRRVATTPAATLAGVAAKLRQIQSERAGDIADDEALRSAIADLERLAGGAASG
jgi:hypothetical protein